MPEKQLAILNQLIEMNNDRIAGYDTVLLETENPSLKHLFSVLGGTSQNNLAELHEEVLDLGGELSHETSVKGKLYQVWMDLKAAVTGKNEKTILNSCVFGENQISDLYLEVLEHNHGVLSARQLLMLQKQHQELRKDLDKIHELLQSDTITSAQYHTQTSHGFSIGDEVHQEFGSQAMTVIAFEPELVENVVTQWEDELGNIITGKFMDAQLIAGHPITE